MSTTSIGMGTQDSAEREKFENEVKRLTEAAQKAGVMLRLLGSLAFHVHCPHYGFLQAKLGRAYTDIDFAAYAQQAKQVRQLLTGLGYSEDREIFVVTEGSRAIFENPGSGLHVDVFYDKLDFCHVIRWDGRLETDWPTIPLAEMLLEKMQIVKINEKDLIDTIMLFLEHGLGEVDAETINVDHIAGLCAADWGLWRTTTMNLAKVSQIAETYPQLSAADKATVANHVTNILARLEADPNR
ncbi:MAG TPA: hypothetical protein VGD99_09440 [Anaerolineae bacterium]|jgi:hypothetical protein